MKLPGVLFLSLLYLYPGPTHIAHATDRIVLIGGELRGSPSRHNYPNAIRLLESLLESWLEEHRHDIVVDAYPEGWPAATVALDGAAALVWYFDGLERHPLADAAIRAKFEDLMGEGVGLVSLHQALTVPADDEVINLGKSLGGARYGMFDRAMETVRLRPAAAHPVTSGVSTFAYRDEFYPTIRFNDSGGRLTPLLTADLHVHFRAGEHLIIDEPERTVVAWAFERDNGGRSFGYSGVHYLIALEELPLRRLLLNAIFWTAGLEVPKFGVQSNREAAPRTRSASLQQTGRP